MEPWKPFSSLKPNIATSVFNYSTKIAGSGLPFTNEILWIFIYPVIAVRYVQETLSSRSSQHTTLTIHLSEISISSELRLTLTTTQPVFLSVFGTDYAY
jgi:hypothetical protein